MIYPSPSKPVSKLLLALLCSTAFFATPALAARQPTAPTPPGNGEVFSAALEKLENELKGNSAPEAEMKPLIAANPADAIDASPAQPEAIIHNGPVILAPTEPVKPAKAEPAKPAAKLARKKSKGKKPTVAVAEPPPPEKSQTVLLGEKSANEADKPDEPAHPALAEPESPKADAPAASNDPSTNDPFIQALASVYTHHPQLKAQRELQKATDEGVAQAISGFRPTVIADYSKGRSDSETNNGGSTRTNPASKSLDVTQPIFNGGSTVASYASARDRVRAGQSNLTALEQQVLLDAVFAYTNVVNAQAVLEVNQNNVDLLNQELKATQARFDVGELTKTDLAQAQSRLATAQANERQALGNLDSAHATFRRVIGFDAPSKLELPQLPGGIPSTLDTATGLASANEPTLEAAQHLEHAAGSDVDIRTGSLLPSVNVTGSVNRDDNVSSIQSSSSSNRILLNVSVPLYQSGAEWSRVREAKYQAQRARYTTMDTKDAVIESATRAWQDYQTAKAVIVSNEEAVRASNIAMQSIRQENKYGVRTILDVLNTQQDMFNAQVNLVNARVSERQAAYRLLATIGQLTAKGLNLPVDINDPAEHYEGVKYKLIGF
jgi:outer membrane protein